ncbi:MAG: FHA domain-containing protein, partial [Planctomycetota bacterium]
PASPVQPPHEPFQSLRLTARTRGRITDPRQADVFAFGATLYFAAAGSPAYPGDDPQRVLEATRSSRPRALMDARPDLAPTWASAIDRCLDPDPSIRYGDMTEVQLHLTTKSQPSVVLPAAHCALCATPVTNHHCRFCDAAMHRDWVWRTRTNHGIERWLRIPTVNHHLGREPFFGTDRSVSRTHVLVRTRGNTVVAADHRSCNGSQLNGHPLSSEFTPVRAGDVLTFSSCSARLEPIAHLAQALAASETRASPRSVSTSPALS